MPDETCPPPHPTLLRHPGLRRDDDGGCSTIDDVLANEVPVALVYNGISHAVMMASPADLEDFAIGFSLAEGIVERAAEIRDIERIDHDAGIELTIEIAPARFAGLKERRRSLTGRTGCGLCGIESLEALDLIRPGTVPAGPTIGADVIATAMAGLAAGQALNRESHAVHAAGFAGPDGAVRLIREDVGRHNAVDKLTGAMARAGLDPAAGFMVVTSRCSYEIVQKAARAGIAVVCAVSAPTALAVRLAEGLGMTLVAFARGPRHTIFSHAERIRP
ncbi:formate dehydrogenase accessory sulfurtransferase FdhD [Zavarzinia compransoris]|uniref:formate dehydrogenase accessory sulfurtransferase FdhD n=1 Tax=Zavarzinia marina TaxID=2911065 RepID=UPI001F26DD01|nr:formate dehydrogenase accessory sulfurtransferase FdhD [Zavarzinia marina]MCF4166227.1 formate dehydrogenase accessory sulfurtransferase FdhD [Zavarzinia marina]